MIRDITANIITFIKISPCAGQLEVGILRTICLRRWWSAFELQEVITPYGKANNLDSGNTFFWNQQPPAFGGQFLHEN